MKPYFSTTMSLVIVNYVKSRDRIFEKVREIATRFVIFPATTGTIE